MILKKQDFFEAVLRVRAFKFHRPYMLCDGDNDKLNKYIWKRLLCTGAFRFQQRGRMCVTWAILCLLFCFVRKGLYVMAGVHSHLRRSSSWMPSRSQGEETLLARARVGFSSLILSPLLSFIQKEILEIAVGITLAEACKGFLLLPYASVFLLLPGPSSLTLLSLSEWKSDARKASQNKKTPPST